MSQDKAVFSPRLLELGALLVREAIRIKEGQIVEVTLTGERVYLDFLDEITLAISQLGAFPVIRLNSPSYRRRFMQTVPEEYLMKPPPQMLKWIEDIDRHINIVADAPRFNPIHISDKRRKVHRDAQKKITGRIKQKNITTIYLPTPQLADYCGVATDFFDHYLFNALSIPYADLRKKCRKVADSIRGAERVITLLSGDSHELHCRLMDRQVFIEDGRHELPAGMVFFSPVEESVAGTVRIQRAECNGAVIRGLILEFAKGRIVHSEAEDNHKVFQDLLKNSYGDTDAFAGIGIGLNPGISNAISCQMFDFYRHNMIHIGLGSNLTYGGTNFSDMFIRMQLDEPSIRINGDVLIAADPRDPGTP